MIGGFNSRGALRVMMCSVMTFSDLFSLIDYVTSKVQ